MTSSSKLNFAVIGCGALARAQHIPNIVASNKANLHTCIDLDDKALKECQEKFGAKHTGKDYQKAIDNPQVQAICLATTEKLRLPVIKAAAQAGKPVYVEKPMATSLEECYEIQKVVTQAKIPFCVGHNRRCSPAMIEAHEIFQKHIQDNAPCPWRWNREKENRPNLPEDGAPSMSVRINDDWYSWKSWVFDKTQAPHGPMLFEMTHFTDICNWFLDDKPVEVMAMESGMLNHAVIIRYKNGQIATINMGANGSFGYPKELYEIMANNSVLAIDHMVEIRTAGIKDAPTKKTYPLLDDKYPDIGKEGGISGWLEKKRAACQEAEKENDPMLQFSADPDKGHAHAIELFIDEIYGKHKPVCPVDDALLATRVAFAAVKSAKEKRLVKMEEI